MARELGCRTVLVPRTAGALSACGALYSDVISEFSAIRYAETNALDHDAVNAALGTVRASADEFLGSLDGVGVVGERREYFEEARYRAQVWELTVPLPRPSLDGPEDVAALEEAFHDVHEGIFAVREPGQYLECLAWKARAVAELAKPALRGDKDDVQGEAEPTEYAVARFRGLPPGEVPRYDGEDLPAGAEIEGPAVIREPTTTVIVYPGSRAVVTATGNYLLHVDPPAAGSPAAGAHQEVTAP